MYIKTPFSLERVMHVERSTMGLEAQWRPRGNVIPAYAGIQEPGGRLDSRVRGNDHHALIQYGCTPKCITRSKATPTILLLIAKVLVTSPSRVALRELWDHFLCQQAERVHYALIGDLATGVHV